MSRDVDFQITIPFLNFLNNLVHKSPWNNEILISMGYKSLVQRPEEVSKLAVTTSKEAQ